MYYFSHLSVITLIRADKIIIIIIIVIITAIIIISIIYIASVLYFVCLCFVSFFTSSQFVIGLRALLLCFAVSCGGSRNCFPDIENIFNNKAKSEDF
jgi:hypothetical protein